MRTRSRSKERTKNSTDTVERDATAKSEKDGSTNTLIQSTQASEVAVSATSVSITSAPPSQPPLRCPVFRRRLLFIPESILRRGQGAEHYSCDACNGVFYGDNEELLRCKFPELDIREWTKAHANQAPEPDQTHYLCRKGDHESCPGFRFVNRNRVPCSCKCHPKGEPHEYGSHQRPSKYWTDGPGARQRPFWTAPEQDTKVDSDRQTNDQSTKLSPDAEDCWHCGGTQDCDCITCHQNGGRCVMCCRENQ